MLILLFNLIFMMQPVEVPEFVEQIDTMTCSLNVVSCGESWEDTLTDTEYRIMMCESKGNNFAENPNSSAKGIFQFLDGTWENYCTGDVFSPEDNLKCFRKLYPRHPTWWECR